jgi:hypothetical protein
MRYGKRNITYNYSLDGNPLDDSHVERDLGVLFSDDLKWEHQVAKATGQANSKLAQIKNSFTCLDPEIIRPLYLTMVRPHLDYAAQVWNPYLLKDIKTLEKVQRRATKLPPNLKKKPYKERLKELKLTTLEIRRERGDLIEFYKAEKGLEEIRWVKEIRKGSKNTGPELRRPSNVYRENITLTNNATRENFFLNRVIPIWNSLPYSIRHSESVNSFKNGIDKLPKYAV